MRRPAARILTAVVGLAVVVAGLLLTLTGGGGSARPASARTSPAGSPTVARTRTPCGVRTLGDVAKASAPLAGAAVNSVVSGLAVDDFAVSGTTVAILSAGSIRLLTTAGATLASFSVGGGHEVGGVALDDGGDVYVGSYPNLVEKLSPTGSVLWSHAVGMEISALWSTGSGRTFRLGVVSRGVTGSTMLDAAGAGAGTSPISGTVVSDTGGVVYADDGKYVRTYRDGALTHIFGADHSTNDVLAQGGPWHFYQQGGAVPAPGGTVLVADATRGIEAFTADGYLRGIADDAAIGSLSSQSRLQVVGSDVWFVNGGRGSTQNVSRISMANLLAQAMAPAFPRYILGPGAGVSTPYVGQLVPVGRQPAITATFDPWWATVAAGLRLQWSLTSSYQHEQGGVGPRTSMALPHTVQALSSVALRVPSVGPGAYELDARLLDASGASVGATCLYVTVASAGDRLDLAGLPGTAGPSGPTPDRAVALADELGTGGDRVGVDWSQLLPGGPDSTGAEDFTALQGNVDAAVREAGKRRVSWWVLVGMRDPTIQGLIANGRWASRVAELVTHFKGVVPAWEAYNEPNSDDSSAADYVGKILGPFSRAVRASDPAAKVIGGSTLNVSLAYWKSIAAAGGLPMMDIAGVHPYTSFNDSWEEQGIVADLRALKAVTGKLPLWDTESAWWSAGPASIFSTADKAARASIWMRVLGMGPWNYFLTEGDYGDYPGLSYSLISSGITAPDDFVNPAALALQTAAAQLGGRSYLGLVDTGIPHAYAARFGPVKGDGTGLLAVWTDDATIAAHVTTTSAAAVTSTDEYGATATGTVAAGRPTGLTLLPSVRYLRYPAAADLRVLPAETYGTDILRGVLGSGASAAMENAPAAATDGISDLGDGGSVTGASAWVSAAGDPHPSLTFTLPSAKTLNRIDVVSASLGSVVPGLRDYAVDVGSGASFTQVAMVKDNLTQRVHQLDFAPTPVHAIRLRVLGVATGGDAGGADPWFCTTQCLNQAVVFSLEAYAGSADADDLSGQRLHYLDAPAGTTGDTAFALTPAGDAVGVTAPSDGAAGVAPTGSAAGDKRNGSAGAHSQPGVSHLALGVVALIVGAALIGCAMAGQFPPWRRTGCLRHPGSRKISSQR